MSAVSFCPTAVLGFFSTAVFMLHKAVPPLQMGLFAFLLVLSVADGLDPPPVPHTTCSCCLHTLMFPVSPQGQLRWSAVAAVPNNTEKPVTQEGACLACTGSLAETLDFGEDSKHLLYCLGRMVSRCEGLGLSWLWSLLLPSAILHPEPCRRPPVCRDWSLI